MLRRDCLGGPTYGWQAVWAVSRGWMWKGASGVPRGFRPGTTQCVEGFIVAGVSVRQLPLASSRRMLIDDGRRDVLCFLSLGWSVVVSVLGRHVCGSVRVDTFVYGFGLRLAGAVADFLGPFCRGRYRGGVGPLLDLLSSDSHALLVGVLSRPVRTRFCLRLVGGLWAGRPTGDVRRCRGGCRQSLNIVTPARQCPCGHVRAWLRVEASRRRRPVPRPVCRGLPQGGHRPLA